MPEQERHAEQGRFQRASNGDTSFDELAKGLSDGNLSRRKALRMFGAALAGGMLASIPGVAWAEKCKPLLHKCTTNIQCCSRNCIKNPKGNGKHCGCPTGQTLCNNKCITCNNTGEVVNPSTCQCECPTGKVVCNNACVSKDCATGEFFNPSTCRCEAVGRNCCACYDPTDPVVGPLNPSTCGEAFFNEEGCRTYCTTHPARYTRYSFTPNATCALLVDGSGSGQGFVCNSRETGCPSGSTFCHSFGGAGSRYCVRDCPGGQTLDPLTCRCVAA